MTLIALFAIHWNLSNLNLSFTPQGIENYLNSFGQYKALFTGTVATCAAYFGLLRVKVSEDANREKIKQDYFNEWKIIFQIRSSEIERNDRLMMRELTKVRRALFNDLYSINFQIQSKEQLEIIFDKNIKALVDFFETHNNLHNELGGAYPDEKHSYSFDSFSFMFLGMIEESYSEIGDDLKELYLMGMNDQRIISQNEYKNALQHWKSM